MITRAYQKERVLVEVKTSVSGFDVMTTLVLGRGYRT